MHPALEQLLILQDRQQKIRQIQTEIKTLPLQRKNLEGQLAASAAGVEALKQKTRQVEVDRKKLELDVEAKKQQIDKYSLQQFQTKKNEEYRALANSTIRAMSAGYSSPAFPAERANSLLCSR